MDNKAYKIQIIIPVYNAEAVIDKCIESLLAQSFNKWQAILIDDCSADNSYKKLLEYSCKDSRLVVLKNDKNMGVSAARNCGLTMLDAEYTTFLDCDDWWEADMLAALYEEAEKGFDVVQCRYMHNFHNGITATPKGLFKKDTRLRGREINRLYRRMLTGINMNHVCMKLIRTGLIKDLRFNENMKTAEDLELCARILKDTGSFSFLDKVLYHYYRRGESLTGGGLSGKEKWAANKKAAKVIRASMREAGIKNPFYYILVPLRVYIITVSKLIRIVKEKTVNKKGGGEL